jgi:hypothetical protein
MRETTPGLSSVVVGSNRSQHSVDPNCRQCFAIEPAAEVATSRRNSLSSRIICRIKCSTIDRGTRCSAQKRDLGDPSLALSNGCNGLRVRWLKLASRVKRRKRRQTESSVLIRPLITTLAQGVSRSWAETDGLQLSGSCAGVSAAWHAQLAARAAK